MLGATPWCRSINGTGDKHHPEPRASDNERYAYRKAIGGRYFKFYKSKVWRKLSYSYRLAHPLCERCQAKGLYVQADVVDHIVADTCGLEPQTWTRATYKVCVMLATEPKRK